MTNSPNAKGAKENNSLTAKAAKDAEERNSLNAKDAKDAKGTLIKIKPRGRQDNAKWGIGNAVGVQTSRKTFVRGANMPRSVSGMPPLARFLRDLEDLVLSLLLLFPSR